MHLRDYHHIHTSPFCPLPCPILLHTDVKPFAFRCGATIVAWRSLRQAYHTDWHPYRTVKTIAPMILGGIGSRIRGIFVLFQILLNGSDGRIVGLGR